jgi:hypothetical protein
MFAREEAGIETPSHKGQSAKVQIFKGKCKGFP